MPHITVKPFESLIMKEDRYANTQLLFKSQDLNSSDEMIGVEVENEKFLLHLKKNPKNWLLKYDKVTRPLNVNLIKQAIGDISIGLKLEILNSNIAIRKAQTKLANQYEKTIKDFIDNMNASSYSLFFLGIMIFLVSSLILFLVINKVIINPIKRVTFALNNLSLGLIAERVDIKGVDEVSEMQKALNIVNDGMQRMSDFAIEIGNEKYNSNFESLSEKDELGNTLIQVRDKLKQVSEKESIVMQNESQRKWIAEGYAKFATLLQNNELEINEYIYKILSNLIS